MRITTEALLMSPHGFNVAKATPVQRAACRARDGLPLGELAAHPDVLAAFGGAEAIAALPGERGLKPMVFWNIASARTAKTTIAVAAAIVDSQTVDVSGLGHGEIPRISILSLKLDVADVPFTRLVSTLQASPVLRPLLIGEPTANMVRVRHPSGCPIEIAVVAGGRAAGGLAARWSAGFIADEAPRMTGREDGVANLDDALSTIRERLLPGAQILPIGSPWAPSGPAYDAVQEFFGRPDENTVVMRTTGPAGNPSYWTPERLERLRQSDEVAWRINALGEFLDPESGLLSPVAIRRHTREFPVELPPEKGAAYAAAVDVGKGRWTLAIVTSRVPEGCWDEPDPLPYYRIALAREVTASDPNAAWEQIAAHCKRYGLSLAEVDQYAAAESAAIARRFGLQLRERAWSASNRLEAFQNLATVLHSGRLELPPDRQVRGDLLAVKLRTTQQSQTIVLPHTSDGRHCDFGPAIAAALRAGTHLHIDCSVIRIPSERSRGTSSARGPRIVRLGPGRIRKTYD